MSFNVNFKIRLPEFRYSPLQKRHFRMRLHVDKRRQAVELRHIVNVVDIILDVIFNLTVFPKWMDLTLYLTKKLKQ